MTTMIKRFGHTVATTTDPRAYFLALGLPFTTATLSQQGYTLHSFDKDQPFEATFTDKDTTRGTWTMTFANWADFNAYVGQKVQIIASYHLTQS